jgi:hypothetical protein
MNYEGGRGKEEGGSGCRPRALAATRYPLPSKITGARFGFLSSEIIIAMAIFIFLIRKMIIAIAIFIFLIRKMIIAIARFIFLIRKMDIAIAIFIFCFGLSFLSLLNPFFI